MTGNRRSLKCLVRRWGAWSCSALPALAFGLRTAAAVSIALGIAFALEVDQAYWAGTTAALVCQPVLGFALRKALFRMIGTLVGAVMTVFLFACFPQDRVGFTLGFAGWCALCGFVATRLTFFAAYGAALAGYTAAIIVGDVINTPDRAFDVALARVTEIEIGIAVATTVLAVTQFGDSRARLGKALRALAEQAVRGLLKAANGEGERPKEEEVRGHLVHLAGLTQLVDQVAGEALHWRFRLGPVRAAQDGLFACFAETQRLWVDQGGAMLFGAWSGCPWDMLPERLRDQMHGTEQPGQPESVRAGLRALAEWGPDGMPHAARIVRALSAATTAMEVAAWLADPARPHPAPAPAFAAPIDPLPALVTATRAYLGVAAAVALWMTSRWPNGPTAITWTAIPILLASPQQEKAYRTALGFSLGTLLAAGLAAITQFAVLPQLQSFWAFSAALAVPLVSLAALSASPSLTPLVGPATFNFVPLVAPANQMSYDPLAFYNTVLGIVGGCMVAGAALRLLPPPPVGVRARRIVASATGDCAAIRAGTWRPTAAQWLDRMRTRAASLPASAEPRVFVQLLATFSLGDDALRAHAGSPASVREAARADH